MSQPNIVLNMIVRNEIANLSRCLASAVPHVTGAVIFDTGSTDGSPEYIRAYFALLGKPCKILRGKFENFEQARNTALLAAKTSHQKCDYILLMDADMELKVDGPLPPLTAECYTLVQVQGGMSYHNARLLRRSSPALYHGVTHEYLGANEQQVLPGNVWWFQDHATGSNRPEKYERDTRLLEGYLKDHPDDPRTLFYLAQTYKDRGMWAKAIPLYAKRIEAGGWEEEVWYSKFQIARAHRDAGNEADFIKTALEAYNMRPTRAEPLYDLARFYREKRDQQQTGWLFGAAAAAISIPNDYLFVEKWIYEYGIDEELSILGNYSAATHVRGRYLTDKLSLSASVPALTRDTARRNMFYYLKPLGEIAASFRAVRIPEVNADATYVNTNPSVAVIDGTIKAIVRTVSYRILPNGTYDYNGLASIRSTSFYASFDDELRLAYAVELERPTGLPVPTTFEVLDLEDMRLIPYNGEIYANACVLEQNTEFWREQYLVKINPDTGETTFPRRIDPDFTPKQHEKNWMPILGSGPLSFMYKPGVVMDYWGTKVRDNPPTLAVDQIAGGGQVIEFEGGWLAIVHTAQPDPNNGKRYYQHRFMWYDHEFVLQKVSRPFVFFDKQVEFAAGLALHPTAPQVIVSFGVRDCEAWLGTINLDDLRTLIWHS